MQTLSQRPPAKRVAWIIPPQALKDRGAKCPNRCGWNPAVAGFGKPNKTGGISRAAKINSAHRPGSLYDPFWQCH